MFHVPYISKENTFDHVCRSNLQYKVICWTEQTTTTNMIHHKILEIIIPILTGNYAGYLDIKDIKHSLQRLISKFDEHPIPSAEKLSHLQASVSREQFQVIGQFDLTDVNFKLAFTKLNEKYNNLDSVISEVYHKIGLMKRVSNTPQSLNTLFHELKGLATLRSMHSGENGDRNPPLRYQVICKYPNQIIHLINGTKILNVTEF